MMVCSTFHNTPNSIFRKLLNAISNPALTAEVLFTVRWDGSPAEVTLSRSSGHKTFDQAAITAGLDFASGDAVVVMDADLQDPPELLPEMRSRSGTTERSV